MCGSSILIYNSALIIMLVLIFSVLRIMDIGISEKDIIQPTANTSRMSWTESAWLPEELINLLLIYHYIYMHTFQEHDKEKV